MGLSNKAPCLDPSNGGGCQCFCGEPTPLLSSDPCLGTDGGGPGEGLLSVRSLLDVGIGMGRAAIGAELPGKLLNVAARELARDRVRLSPSSTPKVRRGGDVPAGGDGVKGRSSALLLSRSDGGKVALLGLRGLGG